MKHSLLLIPVICVMMLSAFESQAQGRPSRNERRVWNKEMQSVKTDYIARKLELTDQQCEQFVPLYTQMDAEIRKLNDDTRSMQEELKKKGKSCTDIEYEKAAEALYELKGRENEIELNYFEKFKKILTPRQLFELKDAEQDFTKELMRQHRRVFKQR